VPSTASVPQPSVGTTNEYFERLLPNATYLRLIGVVTKKEWRHLVVLKKIQSEFSLVRGNRRRGIRREKKKKVNKYFKIVLFLVGNFYGESPGLYLE